MKMKDFVTSPLHSNELPVNPEADAFASNSPAAIPTVAPDALLCAAGAELEHHWLHVAIPTYAAVTAWHAFRRALAVAQPLPALN